MSEKLTTRLREIVAEAEELRTELAGLVEKDELSDEENVRFNALTGEESPITAIASEKADIEKRLAVLDAAMNVAATEVGEDRSFQFMKPTETEVDIRTAGRGEVRSAALKRLEQEHASQQVLVSDASAAAIEGMFGRRAIDLDGDVQFDGDLLARRFLATETPAYHSAWQKAMKGHDNTWTEEERAAMAYFRAAEQSLTSASGGYGVPVLIDPTIILTSGAGDAPILSVSRIERITNNAWKGVSSAGVAFANEVESDPIAAQQATLAQPSITAHKIAAFVPYTFEIEGDYPGFASEMQTLISQAYVDYLAIKTMTGTGTIEPWGIFTAIDQTAGSEVTPTTDGALGAVDALKVWAQLPERARARATWVSNVTVQNQFRNNGTTAGFFSVDLTENNIARMLGRPYILSDYAPSFSGTTGASNLVVVGDFSKYVIVQRVGMTVERVPHVFDGDGLPKGQRAWLAWARVGADSVDDNAFRLLQNA